MYLTSGYFNLVSGMEECYQSWQFLCEANQKHRRDLCQEGMEPEACLSLNEDLYSEYEEAWKACEQLVSTSQDREYLYDKAELYPLFMLEESSNVISFRDS